MWLHGRYITAPDVRMKQTAPTQVWCGFCAIYVMQVVVTDIKELIAWYCMCMYGICIYIYTHTDIDSVYIHFFNMAGAVFRASSSEATKTCATLAKSRLRFRWLQRKGQPFFQTCNMSCGWNYFHETICCTGKVDTLKMGPCKCTRQIARCIVQDTFPNVLSMLLALSSSWHWFNPCPWWHFFPI